jgi:hypothetical protein
LGVAARTGNPRLKIVRSPDAPVEPPMKVETFERRLAEYFERYEMTLQILTARLRGKAAPQDIILLACARLDSLADHALPTKRSQHDKFVQFLKKHAGQGVVLERVSVPDLYASVLVEWWQLEGMLERAGRLQMFDPIRQREYVEMYKRSGLALTEPDLEGLMAFLAGELRRHYRVIPHQSTTKPHDDSVAAIMERLNKAAAKQSKGRYVAGVEAFQPIVQAHCLRSILYREYRNGAIHGAGVGIDDDDFFRGSAPRWSVIEYEFASAKPVFQVLFPGRSYSRFMRIVSWLPRANA